LQKLKHLWFGFFLDFLAYRSRQAEMRLRTRSLSLASLCFPEISILSLVAAAAVGEVPALDRDVGDFLGVIVEVTDDEMRLRILGSTIWIECVTRLGKELMRSDMKGREL
jgi:hypothetical protein